MSWINSNEPLVARFIAGFSTVTLVAYCTSVLFYVATSGDLGIRCLLNDDLKEGIELRQFIPVSESQSNGLPAYFGVMPSAGDRLLEIGTERIHSFASFSQALEDLRGELGTPAKYDARVEDSNPEDIVRYASLPAVIQYVSRKSQATENEGNLVDQTSSAANIAQAKYVRVTFVDQDTGEVEQSWLMLRSLPTLEVVLSIVWCLLEFAIFMLAALSFSNRPTDKAGRLFFALCFFTLPAFVGGYHWWVIASSPLLTLPFVVSAVLLPVITLHFYLNYPRRNVVLERYRVGSKIALYLIPGLALIALLSILMTSYVWFSPSEKVPGMQILMNWTRYVADAYIMISLVYFGISIGVMANNYRKCYHPAEQKQLQWILGAACLALPLVLYTVFLAFFDRVGMALGRGRIPMILVSLLFLTAFAIGMIRYRLMLIDQIITRRALYFVMSQSLTLTYSLLIAVGSLLTVYRGMTVREQLFPLAIILTLGILTLGWLRDRAQEAIDRRFFREKYRLDRAMHQMNTIVAQVADVRSLADHMLRSCREVLQVRFSALYLRDAKTQQFDLVAAVPTPLLPGRITLDSQLEELFSEAGSYQRVSGASRQPLIKLQELQRELNSQFIHGFEVQGELTGLVVLGPKISASPFTAEDSTFVAAIGQMTGVALQCVRVQQNVSRLDDMLQEKIRKIETQERQIAVLQQQVQAETSETQSGELRQPEMFDRGEIRGSSPAIVSVLESARKVAISDTSVMIRGESGTGKELLAQAIHNNSSRRDQPMVSVNCAALSPTLLESELFGHVKGAFTGAIKDTPGRFQLADKGTLFLDEVGDLPADVQVKLLRVLQERKFEPVGSRESVSVDVRLITATHQNLEERIRQGQFRQDLYYRLNVITLTLPALRERKEDIFELSLTFMKEAAEQANKSIRDIDDLAFRALLNYDWPGNIRELHNAIHRAVVLAESEIIVLENLPLEVRQAVSEEPMSIFQATSEPTAHLEVKPADADVPTHNQQRTKLSRREEYLQLKQALQQSDGNKAQAARLLNMPRSTFYSKLKKHKL